MSAEFQLVTGRLTACPLGFNGMRSASLHACVELDAGAYRAEGFGADNAKPETLPWLAAGIAARAELPLAGWIALEASAGVRVLPQHYKLVFTGADPAADLIIYEMPVISAGFALGAALRWP